MSPRLALLVFGLPLLIVTRAAMSQADPAGIAERARRIHESAILVDGHNDLPWELRRRGDWSFDRIDIAKRLDKGQTDIPRLRAGGVKAQFWSVYIPSEHADPAKTVLQQIDVVHRMIERYPDTFELALSADDIERIARSGKIASLIGMEGGLAIENDLALLRSFARLGARYMTLTHNVSTDWADAAFGTHAHDGLTPFGERVVREMNRLGMLVDIAHVSPATMADALRVSKAPVIASHSNAFALCPSPRNVPDDILAGIKANGGVVMINVFPGFVNGEIARASEDARRELKAKYPDPREFGRAMNEWSRAHPKPSTTLGQVVDHIDHIVKVAGIDHVGLGGDYDGITSTPVGLEDVSCYPRITEELLRRGYSEPDIVKILGGNVIRAFRRAGEVAKELRSSTPPEVDPPGPEPLD
jgi:membrane dipeptidase